jgi:hypothetical protein
LFDTERRLLVDYQQGFGRLVTSSSIAAIKPQIFNQLTSLLHFATLNELPAIIRGLDLSQSGQSIAVDDGISVDMGYFNQVHPVVY